MFQLSYNRYGENIEVSFSLRNPCTYIDTAVFPYSLEGYKMACAWVENKREEWFSAFYTSIELKDIQNNLIESE